MRFLARECGCGVDAKDNDGTTPLMAAADYARDAAVRELLALGADAAVAKPDGTRAVHRAASSALSSGPVDDPNSIAAASATEALIDADAEKDVFLNCPSDVGTPFLCACARGAEATARMLTAKGADARAVTPAGVGAATLAASSGVLGALAAALDAGAPTAARPAGGMTALHVAASHPNAESVSAEAVDLLLRAGADPNAEDGEGLKAIHAAAVTGRVAVVERLVAVTAADVGVAMGVQGTAMASQAAGVVLMSNDLRRLADGVVGALLSCTRRVPLPPRPRLDARGGRLAGWQTRSVCRSRECSIVGVRAAAWPRLPWPGPFACRWLGELSRRRTP